MTTLTGEDTATSGSPSTVTTPAAPRAMGASAAPQISNLDGNTRVYAGSAILIDEGADASVSDSDSSDFDSGVLTVNIRVGGSSHDTLAVKNTGSGTGQIGLDGANVQYEGTTIGTFSGDTSGTSLTVTLNSDANSTAVSALLSQISYANSEANPTDSRIIRLYSE